MGAELLFGILIPFLTSAGSPNGGSITHESSFEINDSLQWNLVMPSFDQSLGTLTGVTVGSYIGLNRSGGLELTSTGRICETNSWDYPYYQRFPWDDEIGQEGGSWWSLRCLVPNVVYADMPFYKIGEKVVMTTISGTFDGVLDYAGTSGKSWTTKTPMKGNAEYYNDPAVLASFISPTGIIFLDYETKYKYEQWMFVLGTAHYSVYSTTANRGKIKVTYHYQ